MKINSALKPKLRGMGTRDSRCSHPGHRGSSLGRQGLRTTATIACRGGSKTG